METLYTVKELATYYGKTENAIRFMVYKNKIKRDGTLKRRGSPALYKRNILFKSAGTRLCIECNKEFEVYHQKDKYCQKSCYQASLNRRNKKTNRVQSYTSSRETDFPFSDRAYQTKKGKEERKKLNECSVDCLLDEFGDLE